MDRIFAPSATPPVCSQASANPLAKGLDKVLQPYMETWHAPLANGKARPDGSLERLAAGVIAGIAWAASELHGASEAQASLVQCELKHSLERVWAQEAVPNEEETGSLASDIVHTLRQANIEGNAPKVTLALASSVLDHIPKQAIQAPELLDAIVNINSDSSTLESLDMLTKDPDETRHASLLYYSSVAVWANLGHPDERAARTQAVKGIQAHCTQPNLHGFGLTTLPPLHSGLWTLDASENKLKHLQVLPESLYKLDVSDNALETLPDRLPEELEYLYISDNPFIELPESIKDLDSDVEVWARGIPETVYQDLDVAVARGWVCCDIEFCSELDIG